MAPHLSDQPQGNTRPLLVGLKPPCGPSIRPATDRLPPDVYFACYSCFYSLASGPAHTTGKIAKSNPILQFGCRISRLQVDHKTDIVGIRPVGVGAHPPGVPPGIAWPS